MLRTSISLKASTFLFFAALIGVSTTAVNAQGPTYAPWTTVGSAGTVDEADAANVNFGSPVPGAVSLWSAGTVHIRYNVVAVPGLIGGTGLTLFARLLDHTSPGQESGAERIIIRFKQYGLFTGVTKTLLTLDSDNPDFGPPTGSFQVLSVATILPWCAPSPPLNFAENSYFMDVEITRTPSRLSIDTVFTPRPALGMITLQNFTTCTF